MYKDKNYRNSLNRIKTRDRRIEKLKGDIISLKAYIKKIGNRSRWRKFALAEARENLKVSQNENKEIIQFIRTPFEKRGFNIMDLAIRFNKTYEQQDELSYKELYLLLYLYNVEFNSSFNISKQLGLSRYLVNELVFEVKNKGMIVSKKAGRFNYVYITDFGRAAVKRFIELVKKQKSISI